MDGIAEVPGTHPKPESLRVDRDSAVVVMIAVAEVVRDGDEGGSSAEEGEEEPSVTEVVGRNMLCVGKAAVHSAAAAVPFSQSNPHSHWH